MLACYRTKRRREPIKTLPDGRQKCLTEAGWQKRRKEVFERERGLCERCMAFAPLHNTDRAFAGHAHHREGRKRGDDREMMLEWLCGRCHAVEHQPDKVLPRKTS
jgi:hypothetical protein